LRGPGSWFCEGAGVELMTTAHVNRKTEQRYFDRKDISG